MSTLIAEPADEQRVIDELMETPYAIIADPALKAQLIAARQQAGSDRWDEVWDGVYMLMPLPNDEHQELVTNFTTVLTISIQWQKLGLVRPGVNVSDRIEGWKENYRCPDVVVFLNETRAQNHDTFWYGGPDFAIEVVSPFDRTREKLPFYASIGMRELLLVDREPWSLELFRLDAGVLKQIGGATTDEVDELRSEIVPLSFTLQPNEGRPQVVVRHRDGQQVWTI
ncbi:MAG: Uma2 family endonuclease [Planctomycetaceae bacterium]|nr:Uma2 family endonuclease [Planctomycetaceae bacterium]